MTLPRVGFIGLGIMGKPMAGHILAAGYPLTVYNRTRSKCEEPASKGAQVADSPAELASRSDLIFIIVSDSPDVEEVVLAERGVLAGIREEAVVVDMSTVSPETERHLAEKLREKGADLLDAPVSGGDVGARNATLAIMVGGEKETFERLLSLFKVMGKNITHCGPVGSGQLTKLANQILVALNLLGVCEALAFVRKNGLEPRTVIQAVETGAAGSWQLSNLGPRIVDRDFSPGFMVDLIVKDLRLVLETAEASRVALPATGVVRQLFHSVQAAGGGRDGTQALARVLETLGSLSEKD